MYIPWDLRLIQFDAEGTGAGGALVLLASIAWRTVHAFVEKRTHSAYAQDRVVFSLEPAFANWVALLLPQ